MIEIAPEVAAPLRLDRPVVALESTVIAHGLPQPTNLETAQRLEEIVRESRAVPATVGIIAGTLKVGLNAAEIRKLAEFFFQAEVGIRDLPIAVAESWNGATTVATTCWIAHRAGIKVF